MEKKKQVGPYVLERELGRGNYGAVYLAHHTDLQRPVALKVLIATGDKTAAARFDREARVASRLSHPAIVGCFDVGRDEKRDVHYLAMDYVEGPTLKQKIKEGPLEVGAAYDIALAVAGALAHAHENGVIHRDLKPANIIIDAQGRPHVTDFGLARDLSDGDMMLTTDGHMVGTPDYMAPEQTTGEPVDVRVDVYALGAILYQCLTGKKPFQGPKLAHLVHQIRLGKPERPAKLRPEIPFALEDVILHAMARKRDERYADGAELEAALKEVDPRSLSTTAVAWVARNSRELLLGAIGVVAFLIVVIGVILIVRGRAPEPEVATKTAEAASAKTVPAALPTPTATAVTPTPTPRPRPTRPAEPSRASLEALDDDALAAHRARYPRQLEPYLVLARRKIAAWSFGEARDLLDEARDRSRGERKHARIGVVRAEIEGQEADERRIVKEIRSKYTVDLDAPASLAAAKAQLKKRPGSLNLRRLIVHAYAVEGDFARGAKLLRGHRGGPLSARDRQNLQVFDQLLQLSKGETGGPTKGWLPFEGGLWRVNERGELEGSLVGLGMFGFCGRLAADAPALEGARTISVEMKFKPKEKNAFAGLMFAVESPGTMLIAYPFQESDELPRLRAMTGETWEKGFRLALFRKGRWDHIDTQPASFGDGWFKLELRITPTSVVPVIEGKALKKVELTALPRGKVGVMKFYETTACFRNLRWR